MLTIVALQILSALIVHEQQADQGCHSDLRRRVLSINKKYRAVWHVIIELQQGICLHSF